MPGLTFSSKYIGFQDYQPDPEDLCSLCGGNFGKAAMIEGKDKIHICMECVDILWVMKKERDDKQRDEAVAVMNGLWTPNSKMHCEAIYDAIKSGKIVIN